MDYQGNSKKDKPEIGVSKPKIEKVISGEVVIKKRSIGRRFRDIFIEADFGTVVRCVISDVMIPAAKNMLMESADRGIERLLYGDIRAPRRRYGPGPGLGQRITYNSPINRPYLGIAQVAPPIDPRSRSLSRLNRDDFILASREEAELVLDQMNDVLSQYEVVTLAELNSLVGYPSTHVDQKWGWLTLQGVQIKQIREGYLLDLPPCEPIQ